MALARQQSTGREDGRIEDYLNDKLQTEADLDGIDVLLNNVLEQQTLLQQQVLVSMCHSNGYAK